MKRWIVGAGMLLATTAHALPSAGNGDWIDGPEMGSCFYCDPPYLTDCMETDLLVREVVGMHGLHVSEQFLNGVSLLTGLAYRGRVSLTLHWGNADTASETVHWQRSDGFAVEAQRQIRAVWTDTGYEVIHDHGQIRCH